MKMSKLEETLATAAILCRSSLQKTRSFQIKSLAEYSAVALKAFWQEMSTGKVKKKKRAPGGETMRLRLEKLKEMLITYCQREN